MGLDNRDYARGGFRSEGMLRRSGGASVAPLSCNTWIMIVCAVVFILDATLYASKVGWWSHHGDRKKDATINLRDGSRVRPDRAPPTAQQFMVTTPIVRRGTTEVIGESDYVWSKPLQAFGEFSTAKGFFRVEVWRFITFQFLHADISHLVFNMVGLYCFGGIVEQHLRSRRRYMAFYLVCGIFGALLYLLLNFLGKVLGLQVRGLLFNDIYAPLIGASAGCYGVLVAAAKVAGDEVMLLFGLIPMKIRTAAYGFVAIALIGLVAGAQNAGGDAAHIGGALAGFYFIRHLHQLKNFFDFFSPDRTDGAFEPDARPGRTAERDRQRIAKLQKQLDEVLDKAASKGMQSLTSREKKILQDATKWQRGRSN